MSEKICSIAGCGRVHDARGYCKAHYVRARASGELALIDRVNWRDNYEVSDSGCWIWQGRVDRDGYGARGGVMRQEFGTDRAHRAFYMLLVGPIPDGLVIDHLCRVPACVNPEHLEPVTPEENTQRGENFLAVNRRVQSCPQGHEYSGENLIIKVKRSGQKSRTCKVCRNAQALHAWRKRTGKIAPGEDGWYEWQEVARKTAA